MGFESTIDGPFDLPEEEGRPASGNVVTRRSAHHDREASARLQLRLAPLVAGMKRREESALGALYDEMVGRVYGFALRIVGRPAAAEEIAADVFHQAWREAERYDANRAKVSTWLLMMCRSRALDWLRAADTAMTHEDPTSLVEEEPAQSAPQELLEALETSSAIRAAMEALNPVQRQLVALAFFRGLSHQEIAEHTDLPLGTVKSHLRRALETLRARLAPE